MTKWSPKSAVRARIVHDHHHHHQSDSQDLYSLLLEVARSNDNTVLVCQRTVNRIIVLSSTTEQYTREAKPTRSPAVAEIADRTAYDTLINDHIENNTLISNT